MMDALGGTCGVKNHLFLFTIFFELLRYSLKSLPIGITSTISVFSLRQILPIDIPNRASGGCLLCWLLHSWETLIRGVDTGVICSKCDVLAVTSFPHARHRYIDLSQVGPISGPVFRVACIRLGCRHQLPVPYHFHWNSCLQVHKVWVSRYTT